MSGLFLIIFQPVLRKLKARALAAKEAVATAASLGHPRTPIDPPCVKEEDEELAALGGRIRLVSRKSPVYSQPSSPQDSSQQSASPIEPAYMSPETPPPPSASGSTGSVIPDAQWDGGYVSQADMYGYSYPPQDVGAWQPQPPAPQPQPHHHHQGHPHMSMQGIQMDMGAVQYDGYQHAQPMAAHSQQYMQAQSPVQVPHMHPTSDPHASWNYLFAQFNQV